MKMYFLPLHALLIILFICTVSNGYAQGIIITGSVTEEDGKPLSGASVSAGIGTAVSSDNAGVFRIRIDQFPAVLMVSHVSHISREISVKDSSRITIALKKLDNQLEDVIVIGYGAVRKKDLTGSVSKVNMKDLQKAPVSSFEEALAGRVAGVQVTSQDGQPGAGINIVMRGNNSVTGDNSPLFVIDGFPLEGPNNNAINVNEIESIDFLKDASATAIYGARGANGVVIITTKRGKEGAPVVSFDAYYGIQRNLKQIDLMSAYEFIKLQEERAPATTALLYYQNGKTIESYRNIEGKNWQDELVSTAPIQNYYVAVTGGTAKTKYAISGNLFNQEGIVIASAYRRYQGRASIDQNVNDRVKVGINVNYSNLLQQGNPPSQTNDNGSLNLMYRAWGYRPISGSLNDADLENLLYDPAIDPTNNNIVNPFISARNELRDNTTNNLIANTYLDLQLMKNLKFRATGGLNKTTVRRDVFNNSLTQSGGPRSGNGQGVNGSVTYAELENFLNENTLSYGNKFADKHEINAVGGFTIQTNRTKSYGSSAIQLPNESLGLSGLDEGVPVRVTASGSTWGLISFLGRINYSYDNRYLLTASFRADGSSKFKPANRWSYFPSAALAWKVINERFMKGLSFINDAKLRVSYGKTGNNRIGDFPYLSSLRFPVDATYAFNNSFNNLGGYPAAIGNPDVKWETTAQVNAGMDLSFFRNRLGVTLDVYRKDTRDLLLNAQLPVTTGFDNAFKNIGKVRNEGFELELSALPVQRGSFSWNASFNISFNRSKVLDLTENQEALPVSVTWDGSFNSLPAYIAKRGEPLSQIYGLISDGVYQYADFDKMPDQTYLLKQNITTNGDTRVRIQPGHARYKDLNGDKVVDAFDRTVIGNALPLHIGGFSNNFQYKGIDLNIFIQWSYGNDVLNANRLIFEAGNRGSLNQFKTFEKRWSPTNQDSEIASVTGQGPFSYKSRVVEDGSFVRLKTVSLGYNLAQAMLKRSGIKSVRIYASAQNILTLTGYSGLDPEVSVRNSALTQGFDYSPYPRARTITVGITTTF